MHHVCVHIHIYPQVPAHVRDDTTGKPVFHGVVDRCYNRFRRCVQLYCLVKQEESLLCTEYRRCIVHTHTPSSATSLVSFTSCHSCHLMFYTDRTYKNGANCPTVAHNSSIKLDEFEYDVTSVRPGAHMCIFVHMCSSKSPVRTHPSSQYFVVHHASRRSDEDDGVVLWSDYEISKRRGTTMHLSYVCRCNTPHIT